MLMTVGLVLLGVWLVSLFGVFGGSDLRHVLLLVGLLLLLMGALKARDAALRNDPGAPTLPR
jgi:hypothetical protein